MFRATRLLLLATALHLGCADDTDKGRFACGDHGGTCDRESEVCIVGGPDRCSTCAPKPAACEVDAACACLPPASAPEFGEHRCVDAGTCEAVDGGLALTCAEIAWTCG